MKLAVVLVHYHSPELVQRACEALVRDAEVSGIELDMVVVDNGSRPEDLELLESQPARRLDPGRNLGYAGGANAGIRETSAERIVVMNPDVEVLPGCLGALAEVVADGVAVAGPRFYWDHGKEYVLPPTEAVSRTAEVLAVLARRSARWASLARRRWRRHAHRYWLADQPLAGYDLSGALLMFRRSAWQQVGPFDEAYRLYYEETDWLQRLRAAGLEARFVPTAEAVHLYAQSTAIEPQVEAWRLDSSRRFRRRIYGPFFTRWLERLSGRITIAVNIEPSPSPLFAHPAAWLEVSPSEVGYPAAGRRLSPPSTSPVDLAAVIQSRLAPGTYYLRYVDRAGGELTLTRLEKT